MRESGEQSSFPFPLHFQRLVFWPDKCTSVRISCIGASHLVLLEPVLRTELSHLELQHVSSNFIELSFVVTITKLQTMKVIIDISFSCM